MSGSKLPSRRKDAEIVIFKRTSLKNCADASGAVIVIDVLRAFSTAAYAFAAGTSQITLVGEVEEAFAWRERLPGALVMGEVEGIRVPGFDFGNSPTEIDGKDLSHNVLIHRSSLGTQGAVRSVNASWLFGASFCVAQATVRAVRRLNPDTVSFVVTGKGEDLWGDEDTACADYLEALLLGETPPPAAYLQRVWDSPTGHIFADPLKPDFPASDLDYCTRADCFDFAMQVQRKSDRLVMTPVQ